MLPKINLLNISRHKISIESKLFALFCLCLIFISILNIIANLFLGVTWLLSLYIAIGFFVHIPVYYYTLKDQVSEKGRFWYLVANSLSLIPAWFLNSGSLGSTPLFMLFYLSIAMISLSKNYSLYYTFFFFGAGICCIYLEHLFPEFVIPYPSHPVRNFDIMISFIDVALMIIFMFSTFKKVIDHDHFTLIKSKKSLEITQRELIIAKEAAENATKAKSIFLANMSHEIRTPLNGIVGATDLLNLTILNNEQIDLLNTLQASNSIMIDIVNDLLDISRIEANRMELINRPFKVIDTLRDAENIVKPLLRNKNISLIIEVKEKVPEYIMGDEIRLKQVLINLLSNALKFTEVGYVKLKVNYSISEIEPKLLIEIIDTGIGIAREDLKKLFLPFSQINASITRKYGGAGLGLVICRKLLDMMGGQIFAESETTVGSKFTVFLPVQHYYPNLMLKNSAIGINSNELPVAGMKILIVEDNHFNQIITSKMLEKCGYAFELANNGIQALEKVSSKHFNIILMDMQMPVMDGLVATTEILKRYKRDDNEPPIIIGCTANAMEEDKNSCQNAGMKDFLSKPFTLNELKAVLVRWTKVEQN